jgi:hypothetical protein
VAITSKEEKKNCCVDGPIIALLIIYTMFYQRRPPGSLLTLNGRNIPFVNNVKYLGVIFDKKNDVEITHREDRSQGLQNIRSIIFLIQK